MGSKSHVANMCGPTHSSRSRSGSDARSEIGSEKGHRLDGQDNIGIALALTASQMAGVPFSPSADGK